MENHPDPDPQETQEWIESLEAVIEREGTGRAHFLLEKLMFRARFAKSQLFTSILIRFGIPAP
jgi:pyruvate dehydrogenase complex dehydrogenase (E1) component